MKVKIEQRIELRKMLDTLVRTQKLRFLVHYRNKCALTQLDKSKDQDYKFVWQLFWALPPTERRQWVNTVYGQGCHDDHIATALLDWKRTRLTPLLCELKERDES